jgi:hypothetical protein
MDKYVIDIGARCTRSIATAGSGGAGGNSSGGTGGSSSSGGASGNPAGYFMTKDWKVTTVDWHGCVWTAIDVVSFSSTFIAPKDFTTAPAEGGPYRVSGNVFSDYNSVALLGFNLNEAVTGTGPQCTYDPAKSKTPGPPPATVPSSATGIAFSWNQLMAPPGGFRIALYATDGLTNAAHRWCATVKDPGGPSFAPFSDFNTACWDGTGAKYNNEPIDAVVFQVPGTASTKSAFDFTINGFAPGTSKADAP